MSKEFWVGPNYRTNSLSKNINLIPTRYEVAIYFINIDTILHYTNIYNVEKYINATLLNNDISNIKFIKYKLQSEQEYKNYIFK